MTFFVSLVSALWLGILTSVSPCPLASNVAAVSYLARRTDRPRRVLLSGLLYSLGRMAAYATLGVLIAGSLVNVPRVAFFLQNRMNQILGPVLIVVGMILLGWIRFRLPGLAPSEKTVRRIESLGCLGPLLLGLLFALSFCPVSAGLFFGNLIPLALGQNAPITLPLVYGLGTALPVFAFALAIAFGARGLGSILQRTSQFSAWLGKATGWVLLAVGCHFLLSYLIVPLFRTAT